MQGTAERVLKTMHDHFHLWLWLRLRTFALEYAVKILATSSDIKQESFSQNTGAMPCGCIRYAVGNRLEQVIVKANVDAATHPPSLSLCHLMSGAASEANTSTV